MRYQKTYFRKINRTGFTREKEFDESHAREIGCLFDEKQGIPREKALELVNKWNWSTAYSYRIGF